MKGDVKVRAGIWRMVFLVACFVCFFSSAATAVTVKETKANYGKYGWLLDDSDFAGDSEILIELDHKGARSNHEDWGITAVYSDGVVHQIEELYGNRGWNNDQAFSYTGIYEGLTFDIYLYDFEDKCSNDAMKYRNFSASAVPIPGAVWLFGTGFLGLIGIKRKMK